MGSGPSFPEPTLTWVGGSSYATTDFSSPYDQTNGTSGAYSSAFHPGPRFRAGMVYLSGLLVLFGGQWLASQGDLWAYSIHHRQWAMLATNGAPAPRNSFVFTPINNTHAFLFGGLDIAKQDIHDNSFTDGDLSNELWLYNVVTNSWRLLGGSWGSDVGSRGQQGVAAPSNIPCARYGASGTVDRNGIFWLYGGRGANENDTGTRYTQDDLWSYDLSTRMWTWEQGEQTPANNYDEQTGGCNDDLSCFGDPSNNHPGGLMYHTLVSSTRTGELWLYGGWNSDHTDDTNSIWRYSPTLKQWSHQLMSSEIVHEQGILYWPPSIFIGGATEPSRGAVVTFDTSNDFIWIMGGVHSPIESQDNWDGKIWVLNVSTPDDMRYDSPLSPGNPFSSVGLGYVKIGPGASDYGQDGVWETPGVPNQACIPSPRAFAASALDPNTDSLWIFGGYGYDSNKNLGILADLWLTPLDKRPTACMCDFSIFNGQLAALGATVPWAFPPPQF